MSNADVCRERGWEVGTMVRIADEAGEAIFVLTAVGESSVLGKQIASREFGFSWSKFSQPREEQIGFSLAEASNCANPVPFAGASHGPPPGVEAPR